MPAGLAASDLRELYVDLQRIESGTRFRYYSPHEFPFLLQGDSFSGAPYIIVTVDELTARKTSVVLLSNTCDVSVDNERKEPAYVSVAPLIRVSRWRNALAQLGVSKYSVEETLRQARLHKVSSLFVLQPGFGIEEESLVAFNQVQSMPIARFDGAKPQRLATLSQAAFWLLTVKLSIHFCRTQEGVSRQAV